MIRIALDPQLNETHAPEIQWTWRLALTTMGLTWEQVSPAEPCDVAFVANLADAPHAQFVIQANRAAWANPGAHHLQSLAQAEGLTYPVFQNDGGFALYRATTGRWVCSRDVLFDLFWFATGQGERDLTRIKHGFFDLTGTPLQKQQVLQQAVASRVVQWLEVRLAQGGIIAGEPCWGNGKRVAACAGHDVDYPEVIRWLEPARIMRRQGAGALGTALQVLFGARHHWQFRNWMELEKRLGARSAFYFVARRGSFREYGTGTPDPFYDVTAPRFRELFRTLNGEGFEVGMQASYLAYTSREKFGAEKTQIENASGVPVVGNRHHYWHLNPNDPEETLWIHEQIGLRYDASLTHDHYLGWRRGLLHPFFPFHQTLRRELKTLQIPTGWMDDQLFGQKDANPGDRTRLLQTLADTVNAHEGSLMIDIHEYVFDDALFPGWAAAYRELWEYLARRGDVWFATPAQIAEHWRARYARLVAASRGLQQGMA
ncbi:MAG: hypothetical protein HY868_09620 [Chloroflexi bacterium]|nr:hypothetical protein [Chloroflexota bacterium]